MPTYHIWTIGCQMNKAESERLAARFEELGYKASESINDADLIVLNSCVVRQSAEDRVVNKLHDLKHLKKEKPNTLIALTGCIVDSDTGVLHKKFPFIDHFFKAGEYPPWLAKTVSATLPEKPNPSVYVPISQGCDNFCSYASSPTGADVKQAASRRKSFVRWRNWRGGGLKKSSCWGRMLILMVTTCPTNPTSPTCLKS